MLWLRWLLLLLRLLTWSCSCGFRSPCCIGHSGAHAHGLPRYLRSHRGTGGDRRRRQKREGGTGGDRRQEDRRGSSLWWRQVMFMGAQLEPKSMQQIQTILGTMALITSPTGAGPVHGGPARAEVLHRVGRRGGETCPPAPFSSCLHLVCVFLTGPAPVSPCLLARCWCCC